MREMAISMANSHRDWCKKVSRVASARVRVGLLMGVQNLEAWEEAKAEIAKIPEHPNRVPEDGRNGTGRRDSKSTINGP